MGNEQQESWLKWVALTTTILAVCAAIGSLKGSSYSTRTLLMTTQEANQWSYFQSKSIKQHVTEMQRDLYAVELLKGGSPVLINEIQNRLKTAEENVARYDKEKAEIKVQAETLSKEEDDFKRHSGNFSIAVMFFQIAIMMSAIGTLLKKRYCWVLGLVMGAIGMLYFINGFLVWF